MKIGPYDATEILPGSNVYALGLKILTTTGEVIPYLDASFCEDDEQLSRALEGRGKTVIILANESDVTVSVLAQVGPDALGPVPTVDEFTEVFVDRGGFLPARDVCELVEDGDVAMRVAVLFPEDGKVAVYGLTYPNNKK